MSEEVEFDFSSLLKPKEETVTRRPVLDREPIKPKKTPFSEKISSKMEKTGQKDLDSLEPEDIEILRILAKKYKGRGTNVVRHNQKNPFGQDLARLAFFVQDIDVFRRMHKEGLLTKTKYAGQWQIK